MPLGFYSQMMDTCYGENGMKISRSYPEIQIVELRYTNQFSTIFGEFLFPSQYCTHAVACQMHIIQIETLHL